MKKPPNLTRLSKEELRTHCEQRGLPWDEKSTRGQMIVLITDDVEFRLEEHKSLTSDLQTASAETEWYDMDVDAQTHPGYPERDAQPKRSMMQTGSSSASRGPARIKVPQPEAKAKAKGRGRG